MKLVALVLSLLLTAAAPLAAQITGSVFTDDGRPLANATVAAYRVEALAEARARLVSANPERKALATAITDDAGAFALDPKASGLLGIEVSAEGYASERAIEWSDAKDVTFGLQKAKRLRGRVTAGGGAVEGAVVAVFDATGSLVETAKSDASGAFSIVDLSPMPWSAVAIHPAYARASVPQRWRRTPLTSLDFALTPGRTIAGRVVAGNAAASAGAKLLVDGWPAGVAGDDGTFALTHVNEKALRITATSGSQYGTIAASAKEPVIRLEPTRSITGTITDRKGRPLVGIPIAVMEGAAGGHHGRPYGVEMAFLAVSDAKGAYRIEHLAPEQYMVTPFGAIGTTFPSASADLRRKPTAQRDFAAKMQPILSGVVRDERRKPVAGARVSLFPGGSPNEMPVLYGNGDEYGANTLTGGSGTFRLPLWDGEGGEQKLRVLAMKKGFAAGVSEPFPLAGERTQALAVTLPDGIEVTGRVVDANGKPIAGAAINPSEGEQMLDVIAMPHAGGESWITSDANGAFTVRLNARPHAFVVTKDGYVTATLDDVTPAAGLRPLAITLQQGVEIRGRVVRKNATEAFEGAVYARSLDDAATTNAEVKEDGSFVMKSLRPGDYHVFYEGPGGQAMNRSVKAPTSDLVLELAAVGEIRGRVVDKLTGAPVTQFTVHPVVDEYTTSVRTQMSESEGSPDGTFTLPAPVGKVQLQVSAKGYLMETSPELEVVAGKPVENVVVALSRGRVVQGRITNASGAPVPRARIAFALRGDHGMAPGGISDDDGEYIIDAVPPGELTLTVSAERFATTKKPVPAEGDQKIDVVLAKGKTISGRVVNAAGAPVGGASLWASTAVHGADSQSAESNADGTFRIEGLGAGRYVVSAQKEGGGRVEVRDVLPDAPQPLVVRLESGARGRIVGTVAGYAGRGWLGGSVDATTVGNDNYDSAGGEITRDGRFIIDDAPSGEVQVIATAMSMRAQASSRPVTVTVPPGGEVKVDLAFRDDVVIRGTITDNGQPSPGVQVEFSSVQGMASWRTTADPTGAYEVVGVEPGTYRVAVFQMGGAPYETTYEVSGSSTFDIAVGFAQIEGRVVDDSGAPLRDVRIEAVRVVAPGESGWGGRGAVTDASGAFRLQAQTGTKLQLTATKKGYATATATVHTAGSAQAVALTMVRSEGIRVRVVDARDGSTLTGYIVAIDEVGMQLARGAEQEPDGTSILSLPKGGTYRIAASAKGYASQTVRAAVGANEVRIPLTPGGKLIVKAPAGAGARFTLVMPNGEHYVQCHCNGITEFRLGGAVTTIDHVAPGTYALQVLDARGRVEKSVPVTIQEGGVTTAEVDG